MSALTLGNLVAWCIQTALIVGAGLTTLWLVRLEAPAVRYLFLRGLLAICLTLPLVQPRTVAGLDLQRGASGGVAIAVAPVPPRARPTLNVVFGSCGVRSSAIRAIARPIAWTALGVPNAPKLCPPGPLYVTR